MNQYESEGVERDDIEILKKDVAESRGHIKEILENKLPHLNFKLNLTSCCLIFIALMRSIVVIMVAVRYEGAVHLGEVIGIGCLIFGVMLTMSAIILFSVVSVIREK